MNKFTCEICNKEHPLLTLFEFPKPNIISEISSGSIEKELRMFGKNYFLVGKESAYMQCELILNFKDYDDELEMLVWIVIPKKECSSKLVNLNEINEVSLIGKLYYDIPFYDKCSDLTAEIYINLNGAYSDKPKVTKIIGCKALEKDLETGIQLKKLTSFLSQMHHET